MHAQCASEQLFFGNRMCRTQETKHQSYIRPEPQHMMLVNQGG